MKDIIDFRTADHSDLPMLVAMLAQDELGRKRERYETPLPESYEEAFQAIDYARRAGAGSTGQGADGTYGTAPALDPRAFGSAAPTPPLRAADFGIDTKCMDLAGPLVPVTHRVQTREVVMATPFKVFPGPNCRFSGF